MPTATTKQTIPAPISEKAASRPVRHDPAREALVKALAERQAIEVREFLDNPYDSLACTD